MARNGRYYIGRVIKEGRLNNEKESFEKTLQKPTSIQKGKYEWLITNYQRSDNFIYGKLTKYHPQGTVSVLDRDKAVEQDRLEPDLIIASSPFVYIPEYSGIAYLHVWNQIEQQTFVNRFSEIIEETMQKFFVGCSIEVITDLRSFAIKLAEIESIYEITAKINPPNPLFGHLWEDLKDYLVHRKATEMKVEERSSESDALDSDLKELIEKVVGQQDDAPFIPEQPPDITDAAVLMAADGYGEGKIRGKKEKHDITIRTSETIVSFNLEKEPEPKTLYEKAKGLFESINKRRHLKHK